MGSLSHTPVLERMLAVMADVATELAQFACNVQAGVTGAGVLIFTRLDERGKLDHGYQRVEVKVKREKRNAFVRTVPLWENPVHKGKAKAIRTTTYNEIVPLSEVAHLVVSLLVFRSANPSAIDLLGTRARVEQDEETDHAI